MSNMWKTSHSAVFVRFSIHNYTRMYVFSGSVVEHSLPHPVVEVLVLSNILYPSL